MPNIKNTSFDKESQIVEPEIELKLVFDTINRNRKSIACFGLVGLVLSALFAFSTKRTWEGDFQIVVDEKTNSPLFSLDPELSQLLGMSGTGSGIGSKSKLKTEVGILQSASVLMEVFQFVKTNKTEVKKLRFSKWKKNQLDIDLEKGTSILNIAYRDQDKKIILPVLNRISSIYQDYSETNRLRSVELGINYFKEQIQLFKNKSIISLKEAQQYAIDQDLNIAPEISNQQLQVPNTINIEVIRVKAANRVRVLDRQLAQINYLKENSEELNEQILYIASTIPHLVDVTRNLKAADSRLARLRLDYNENDRIVKNAVKETKSLKKYLIQQITGSLIAQREQAKVQMKAAERPKGVIIKYQMLLSEAYRDKVTVEKLEDQYRLTLLEKARSKEPWRLITTPTLLPYPVAPHRKIILAIGLLSGALLGSINAFVDDRRKDVIFSISQIDSQINWPLLTDVPIDNKKSLEEKLYLLSKSAFSNVQGSIAIILVGDIDDFEIDFLKKYFTNFNSINKLLITRDLRETENSSSLLILTSLGRVKRKEIEVLEEKLLLQNKPILGLLALSKNKLV